MSYSNRSANSLDTSITQEPSEDTALQEMEVDLIPLGDIEQELKSLENFPSEQIAQSVWRDEAEEEERKREQKQQSLTWQHFHAHDPATPSTSSAMLDFNLGLFQQPREDPNTYGGYTNLKTPYAATYIIPDTHIGNPLRGDRYSSPQNYALVQEDPFGDWSAFPSQQYSTKANSSFDMSLAHVTTPGTPFTASSLPSLPYGISASQGMPFSATDAPQKASIVAPVANPPFESYLSGTTSLCGPSGSSHSEQNLWTEDCSSQGSLQVLSEESHTACSTPQEPPFIPSSTLNPGTRKASFKYRNRRQFLEGERKKSHDHQLANTRSKDYNERQKKEKLDKEKQCKFLEEENERMIIKCNGLEALRNNYQRLYNSYKDYLPSIPEML